jgi:hypothetical protein
MLQKEYEAKQKSVRAAFLQLHNWRFKRFVSRTGVNL